MTNQVTAHKSDGSGSAMISPELLARLKVARSLVVLTGAGISAESGVPTFRDMGGYWSRYNPQDLASEAGFRRDPVLVQSWYQEREQRLRSIKPNPGHYAIADLESLFESFLLVTQNVDGLHDRAGSNQCVNVHGSLNRNRCIECNRPCETSLADAETLPHTCSTCDGLIRPGVVWFGEMLPEGAFEKAVSACGSCDVLLTVGTSGVVYPVAALPDVARQNGAYVVEVNLEVGAQTHVMAESLLGRAGEILPVISEAARKARIPSAKPQSAH